MYTLSGGKNARALEQKGAKSSLSADLYYITSLARTFSPIDDRGKLLRMLEHIASELEADMSRNGWTGKTITLKYKLDTYQGMVLGAV